MHPSGPRDVRRGGAASRLLLALSAALLPAAAAAGPAPGEGPGVPADGQDTVWLDDGRVLRCKAGAGDGSRVPLEILGTTMSVPKGRIRKVLYFRDYDSAPRNDQEKEQAGRGLVRWAGSWITPARRDELRSAFEAAERRRRSEEDSRASWKERWEGDTDHFSVEANLSKREFDEYCFLLEEFYRYLKNTIKVPLDTWRGPERLPVFIYGTQDDFRSRFRADTGGASEHTVGYFVPQSEKERLVVWRVPDNRDLTNRILFHEATHFVLYLVREDLPLWLNEGLAEYFGGSDLRYGKFRAGGIQDERLLRFREMIGQDHVIPVKDLLAAPRAAFGLDHYAESWALVHFLLHGRNSSYRGRFLNYLGGWFEGRYGEGEDEQRLRQSLQVNDFGRIARELREYALGLKFEGGAALADRAERRLGEEEDPAAAEKDLEAALSRAGEDPRLLGRVGRLLLRLPGGEAKARPILEKAVSLDPLDGAPRLDLARVLPREDRLRELRLAAALGPDSPRVLAGCARLLYEVELEGKERLSGEKEDAVATEALRFAQMAAAADPDAEHFDLCGRLFLAMGIPDGARIWCKQALDRDPGNPEYSGRLAGAQALAGDAAGFKATLDSLGRFWDAPARRGGPSGERISGGMARAAAISLADQVCVTWDREDRMASALRGYYGGEAPPTETEAAALVSILLRAERPAEAREALEACLRKFPDSEMLRDLGELAEDEGR